MDNVIVVASGKGGTGKSTVCICLSVALVKQGKKVFTRYQEWPYQHNRDSEIDLTSFPEKFEEMLELYRRL